jgi:8-oxo-dGTP pyrophosphatase MutT (NUDIX family)
MSLNCTNCGKSGHYYKACVEPITSFGIILVQVLGCKREEIQAKFMDDAVVNGFENATFRFLMVRRKDSLGYIEILRGKYDIANRAYIQVLIDQTCLLEREKLLTQDFDVLWEELWSGPVSKPYRNEYEPAKIKFEELKATFLADSIQGSKTQWNEPEWGFPKGRRGPNESEIRCATREFNEETRFPFESITILRNCLWIEESFFGSNHVHYRHKYQIAFCFDSIEPSVKVGDNIMEREIGDIRWFTSEEALEKIRPYNVEKKEILLHTSSILRNYCFWPSFVV